MEVFKENLHLKEERLPFNIWITSFSRYYSSYHWHEYTEILYLMEGEAIQRISGNTYQCSRGDLTVINGLDFHSNSTEGAKFLIIQIPPAVMSLYYRDNKRYRITNNFILRSLNNDANKEVKYCIEHMIAEYNNKKEGYGYFLTSYLYRLLGIIFRSSQVENQNEKEYLNQKLILDIISPAIDHIDKNFRSNITLKEAASKAGISSQYFCKCFKKATTYTFTQYINVLRVIYAQDMLIKTSLSITEIAYDAGFSSVNYFNRIFKKMVGVKPLQFRRK